MLKILTSYQWQEVDEYMQKKKGVSLHQLVENASLAFVACFLELERDKNKSLTVLCGTGNNGSDGLAIARILHASGYVNTKVLLIRCQSRESPSFISHLQFLEKTFVPIVEWRGGEMPVIEGDLIIDALLGSGLNRFLEGDLAKLVHYLNRLEKQVIAVDIPTGMPAEGERSFYQPVLKANQVVTFQRAKLAFFFPESAQVFEHFKTVNIGLDENFIASLPSKFYLLEAADIRRIYKKRKPFSHKGTYGKALIIAGQEGTLGAALLCAEACLQAGAGLTTACIPKKSELSLTIRVPEVMFLNEKDIDRRRDEFTTIGIGPGLGMRSKLLKQVMQKDKTPMVIDADALNFLSHHQEYLTEVPAHSILTPHMKEFDRLFGESSSWWNRLQLAREKAEEYQLIIILKNRYTFIVLPNGEVRINPTGNPAMASGGMGDVLTGILVAFLAQGYSAEEAATLGCYVHGWAGDELALEGMGVISASQLVAKIPYVLGKLSDQWSK